jgi:ABC-2 type transport system ATP-binding protein
MPATTDSAIEVSALHKSFGKVHALRGIDFTMPRGSVLGMLGPNGAGKTTAVRVLTTLLRPDSGRVVIEGYDVVRDAAAVRRRIGLAGQATAIQLELTGRENLEIMGRLNHMPRSTVKGRAAELLERFEIADAADRPAKTYSGGMQRRLDLAASLVAEPSVLFLDEPTTGLDPYGRLGMWQIIRELVGRGTTLLLTTQYLEEADELADRVGIISRGRLVAEGSPDELKRTVGTDVIVAQVETVSDDTLRSLRSVPGVDEVVASRHEITVHADNGAAVMSPVALALHEAGATVASLTLRTPTLDDVFLQLTGGHLGEASDTPQRPSADDESSASAPTEGART